MNKKAIATILMVLTVTLSGCGEYADESESTAVSTETEASQTKSDSKIPRYIVTYNISQKHYNLDLDDYIKDKMNDITLQVPVDKDYYDSVEVGQEIDESFRWGSLWMSGSFGSWNVTIQDKQIE